jgi:hypothetical protein
VHYWQAQYEQLGERVAALKAAIADPQATIRDLTQRLYGTKSEKSTRLKTAGAPPQPAPGSEDNSPAVQGTAAGTAPLSP